MKNRQPHPPIQIVLLGFLLLSALVYGCRVVDYDVYNTLEYSWNPKSADLFVNGLFIQSTSVTTLHSKPGGRKTILYHSQ